MSVRVRLTRVGSKKNAMWRVVVADQRSPRDGRFIEMIGHYNPQTEPSQIVIDRERLDHWLQLGARPSQTVQKLMRAENSPPLTATAPAEPAAASDSEAGEAPPAAAEPAAAEPPEPSAAAQSTADAEADAADAATAEGDPGAGPAEPDAGTSDADESAAAAPDSGGDADTEAKSAGGEAGADEESG